MENRHYRVAATRPVSIPIERGGQLKNTGEKEGMADGSHRSQGCSECSDIGPLL